MKRVFTCAIATMTVLGCAVLPVSAAEQSDTVDVMYDNTKTIVDPGADGKWGVRLPATVQFTDDSKTVSVDVELVGLEGNNIEQLGVTADVSVKSTKGMVLSLDDAGKDDAVSYTVTYNDGTDKNMAGTTALTLKLASDNTKATGTATMTGKALKTGVHKDTLTYTVTKTN